MYPIFFIKNMQPAKFVSFALDLAPVSFALAPISFSQNFNHFVFDFLVNSLAGHLLLVY